MACPSLDKPYAKPSDNSSQGPKLKCEMSSKLVRRMMHTCTTGKASNSTKQRFAGPNPGVRSQAWRCNIQERACVFICRSRHACLHPVSLLACNKRRPSVRLCLSGHRPPQTLLHRAASQTLFLSCPPEVEGALNPRFLKILMPHSVRGPLLTSPLHLPYSVVVPC